MKKRLGEMLVEDGIISREILTKALEAQKSQGGMIGQILIRDGHITEENLVAVLGKQLRIPYIPLSNYSINMESARRSDENFCRQNLMVVFDQDDKRIFVAMGDPLNHTGIEELEKSSGLKAQIFLSTPTEVYAMLDVIFSKNATAKLKKAG